MTFATEADRHLWDVKSVGVMAALVASTDTVRGVGLRVGKTKWAARAGLVLVVVAMAASCGDSGTSGESSPTTLDRLTEAPLDLTAGVQVAGRGEDLVVIESGTNDAAIRWATDGTWSALPSIGVNGAWEYVTVGPTVVAGGYECQSDDDGTGYCPDAIVTYFRLAEDLSSWERLDAPAPEATSDIEMTASIGPQDHALFIAGNDELVIDADGEVNDVSFGPYGLRGFNCVVGDTVVSVSAAAPTEPVDEGALPVDRVVDGIGTQSLAAPGGDWDPVEPFPPGIPSQVGLRICGAGFVAILPETGTTEWVFDLAERTVRPVESNTLEMVQSPTFMRPGDQAQAPDGTTLFVRNFDGRTVRRDGLGPWEDTGLVLDGVWATDSAVWGLESTSHEFVTLT